MAGFALLCCSLTIAGLNPLCIKLLTEFPIRSKLDPEVYGPAESAITKEILEKQMNCAMTVEQALAATAW